MKPNAATSTTHKKITPKRKAPAPPLMPKRSAPSSPELKTPNDFIIDEFEELDNNNKNSDELTDDGTKRTQRFPDPYLGERVQPAIEADFGKNKIDAKDSSVIGFYNQGSKRDDFQGLKFRRYFTFRTDDDKELIGSWLTKPQPRDNHRRPHFRN
ncbi:Oidioi.mRNA.OKI2018_I69.chr2.g6405.t1.cds [Oikopleura dioica]|uniref:Oidioi.mRNA.OKI2018_I69.chr2.g6405.t1.cds n=1 Tax=Oikopleura dioica TaxID=34765 RepID=A0ABN7T7R0_OIKDI|nr:Oidioi.mRNA.OKI2018_I69.chr2.g6405.t1.cds [Oikopleura dioica]